MRVIRIIILFIVCLISTGGFFILLSIFDESMQKLSSYEQLLGSSAPAAVVWSSRQ